MCRFSISSFRWCRWRLLVRTPGSWELDSVLEPIAGVELAKEVFTSRARWMPLIIEWNASANMFYHLLLFILLIFKLKCNNLIFNEIVVLNVSYVCLHAFSLHRESSDLDPERWTPYFWGGSITAGIRARSGLNTHSKHLKKKLRLWWGHLPYISSLLRWKANICVYIATMILHQRRYVVDFESV
jgi:hypothetical protein